MLQNLGEVFWKFSTTTPNKTHRAQPARSMELCFAGPGWKGPFSTSLGSNPFHKTCDLASAFRVGCQITNFDIAVLRSCMYVESLIRKAEIGGYLQLRNITFLHCTISIYDQLGRWHLVTSCPKLAYSSRAAAFAVEIWVQMGKMASTAWKNSSGNLPVQLQQ